MRWIFFVCFIIGVVFKMIMIYFNQQQRQCALSDEVKDIYDSTTYQKWQAYENETDKIAIIQDLVDIGIAIFYFFTPIFYQVSMFFSSSILISSLGMLLVFNGFEEIVEVIFDYYETFVIEEKYGMNTTTKKTFIKDFIISLLLDFGLFGLLFVFVHYVYRWFSYYGFIVIFVVLGLIVGWIQKHPIFLMRLFNQFTPLPEGHLKDTIVALLNKHGLKLKGIYVMDASKRTKRANAFCSGQGKEKEICIDDNMLEMYSEEEIVAVFAHEQGHALLKHAERQRFFNALMGLILFLCFIFIFVHPSLYATFHIKQLNYYMVVAVLGWVLGPLMIVLDMMINHYSRLYEYQADAFAAKEGYGDALIDVLKKLTKDGLSNIQPHPIVVKMCYSHPTLSQRILAIKKYQETHQIK